MNKQQKIKHWKAIFAQHQQSDLSIIQFCRDNKINLSTFYAWRKVSDHFRPSSNKI